MEISCIETNRECYVLGASYLLILLWNLIYHVASELRELWVDILALHLCSVNNIRLAGNQGTSLCWGEPPASQLSLATVLTFCGLGRDPRSYAWFWRCCARWISYLISFYKANEVLDLKLIVSDPVTLAGGGTHLIKSAEKIQWEILKAEKNCLQRMGNWTDNFSVK